MRLPAALAGIALAGLAGCGQTGPLYLPEDEATTVITRPAATAPAPTAPAPAPAPATSTAPAPTPEAVPGAPTDTKREPGVRKR